MGVEKALIRVKIDLSFNAQALKKKVAFAT